ncbi:MAG: hypothetical protein ABW080_02405 [Candidatus Thiodiazotropha sp.]
MMPFKEELNYFYLYLKKHIESNYALEVERGDRKCLTRPVMHKINALIRDARLVIADISGANPNVMYEVGLAHAAKKPVLFLTQDPPEEAPFDLRQFDFISYDLADADGLIRQLDLALQEELVDQFSNLYEQACLLLEELNASKSTAISAVSRDIFHQRISPIISLQRLPVDGDEEALAEILLPRVVMDSTDMQVIRTIAAWMDDQYE